jgi:hypothetical protein
VLYEQNKDVEAIRRWRRVLEIKPAAEPNLALAAALNIKNPGNPESLELAAKALAEDPNYVLDSWQKEQLWGPKLRNAAAQLLTEPVLKTDVERAQANAGGHDDLGDE